MQSENILESQDNTAALSLLKDLRVEAHMAQNEIGWQILHRVTVRLTERAKELSATLLAE